MKEFATGPPPGFLKKHPPEQEDLQRKQEILDRYGVQEFDLPTVFDSVLFQGLSRDWSDETDKTKRIGILRQAELHLIQSHFMNQDGHFLRWTKPDNPNNTACFVKIKRLPPHVGKLFYGYNLSKMMATRCFIIREIRSVGFNSPVKIQPDWRHVTIDVVTLANFNK